MTLTRGASVEQQDDATFKFKLSTHSEFGGASHCITGTILVGGKTVGSIEGTLVDRDFIRRFGANGGPGTRTTFRMVCDEVRMSRRIAVIVRTVSTSWAYIAMRYAAKDGAIRGNRG